MIDIIITVCYDIKKGVVSRHFTLEAILGFCYDIVVVKKIDYSLVN